MFGTILIAAMSGREVDTDSAPTDTADPAAMRTAGLFGSGSLAPATPNELIELVRVRDPAPSAPAHF